MNTRTVVEVELFILTLNPVNGRCEEGNIVAISPSYEKLRNWYKSQFADTPYTEEGYRLRFKDGPIKYYNPAYFVDVDKTDMNGHGVRRIWVNITQLDHLRERYNFIEGEIRSD